MTTVHLDSDWPTTLGANSKGVLGEGLVETHLWSIIRDEPGRLLPTFDGFRAGELYTRLRHIRRYIYEIVNEDGSIDRISWNADLAYTLSNLNGAGSGGTSRKLVLEVKTGKYAEVERNQKRVMGLLNENDEHLVLLATVVFNSEPPVDIRYQTLEKDGETSSWYGFSVLDRDL